MMTTTNPTDKPGAALAEQLLRQSEQDAALTPIDAVSDAARAGKFGNEHCFRLLARLWTTRARIPSPSFPTSA